MDYLPPEPPAMVAQASERLLAEYHRIEFSSAFGDMGMIDTLPDTGEWDDTTTWKQRMFLVNFKPGQRVVFAKPTLASKPEFYIDQHNPVSESTFAFFKKIVDRDEAPVLDSNQLQPLRELLGSRITDKRYSTHAFAKDFGPHHTLKVRTYGPDKTYTECIFVIADRKKRLIQEIGYEGATDADQHWSHDAGEMLINIELKPEK